MKNSVFTYDRREIGGYDVTDYTSYYYGGIVELFKQFPNYFSLYSIEVDQKIEEISYELYGSVDYADIILAANNNVFLWSSPYNSDITYDQTQALTGIIIKELDFGEYQDNTTNLGKIIDAIGNRVNTENTNRKTITVPTPKKLNTLLAMVNDYRKNNRMLLDEPE